MDALSSPESCAQFINAFTAAQRGVVTAPSARDDEWKRCCAYVNSYIDDRVAEALRRVSSDERTLPDEKSYIRIVDEMAKVIKDKKALRYQVLSIFSPAHDTVAVTVGNLFFCLARHPEVWSKLREELAPTADQPLSYPLLSSYKYLNWTIRESKRAPLIRRYNMQANSMLALRLFPLAQASQRECLHPCIIPIGGGVDGQRPLCVEKGTVIETNFRLMQRDKDYWGIDADEYRPERWETLRPSWEFTPFSGGPRICPAQKLVYIEAQYITTSIVREFSKLENRDPEPRWIEERRLIWQSRNGCLVGLVK
jgi:cytochrome P450